MARRQRHLVVLALLLAGAGGSSLWLFSDRDGEPDRAPGPAGEPLSKNSPAPTGPVRRSGGDGVTRPDPGTGGLPDGDLSRSEVGTPEALAPDRPFLPEERHDKDEVPGLDPSFEGPLQRGYHENGALAWEAEGKNFGGEWVRDGAWRSFHENGRASEVGHYWRGVEEGPWNWWYDNGESMARGAFVRGSRQGTWLFYQESGALWSQGGYVDGVGEGPWTSWDAEGNVATRGTLAGGKYQGYWEVYSDGTLDPDRSGYYDRGQWTGE